MKQKSIILAAYIAVMVVFILTLGFCNARAENRTGLDLPYGVKKFTDGDVTCYYQPYNKTMSCVK